MDETKKWYESSGVWGGVITIVAVAAGYFGYTIAPDGRLTDLYGVEVESPYSYWFVCKPAALEDRPVRLFHDWLVRAGL